MAKSNAKKALGTLLKIGDGTGSEVFTTLAEVRSIKLGGAKFDEIDVTTLQSDAKEFQYGLKDSGTIDIEVNFTNDATQASLKTAEGLAKNFELHFVTLSSPKKYTFTALVNPFNYDIAPGGVLTATFSLRISGNVNEASI